MKVTRLVLIIFSSLLLVEYQPAVEAAAVRTLLGNLQNELIPRRSPPKEPDQSACSAVAEDLDRLGVDSPRRLRSGTVSFAEIPLRGVQVKKGARTDGLAIRLDAI